MSGDRDRFLSVDDASVAGRYSTLQPQLKWEQQLAKRDSVSVALYKRTNTREDCIW